MRFLLAIHHNRLTKKIWANQPDAARAAYERAHRALLDDLSHAGELVLRGELADVSQGRWVVVNGERATTVGPFPDVLDHLMGFYLVDCPGIDCAVEHAARMPEAATGNAVTVLPVLSLGCADL